MGLITGGIFSASACCTASVIINEPCNTQLEHNWICVCSGCKKKNMYIWADMKEVLITVDSCNEEELGRPIVNFRTILSL